MSYYKYIKYKYKYKYLNDTKNLYGGNSSVPVFTENSSFNDIIKTCDKAFFDNYTKDNLPTEIDDNKKLHIFKLSDNCLIYSYALFDATKDTIIKTYVGGIDNLKRQGKGTVNYREFESGKVSGFINVEQITATWDHDIIDTSQDVVIIDKNGKYSGKIDSQGKKNGKINSKSNIFNGIWRTNDCLENAWGIVHNEDRDYYMGQFKCLLPNATVCAPDNIKHGQGLETITYPKELKIKDKTMRKKKSFIRAVYRISSVEYCGIWYKNNFTEGHGIIHADNYEYYGEVKLLSDGDILCIGKHGYGYRKSLTNDMSSYLGFWDRDTRQGTFSIDIDKNDYFVGSFSEDKRNGSEYNLVEDNTNDRTFSKLLRLFISDKEKKKRDEDKKKIDEEKIKQNKQKQMNKDKINKYIETYKEDFMKYIAYFRCNIQNKYNGMNDCKSNDDIISFPNKYNLEYVKQNIEEILSENTNSIESSQ
jgi:hypothetical protein